MNLINDYEVKINELEKNYNYSLTSLQEANEILNN